MKIQKHLTFKKSYNRISTLSIVIFILTIILIINVENNSILTKCLFGVLILSVIISVCNSLYFRYKSNHVSCPNCENETNVLKEKWDETRKVKCVKCKKIWDLDICFKETTDNHTFD